MKRGLDFGRWIVVVAATCLFGQNLHAQIYDPGAAGAKAAADALSRQQLGQRLMIFGGENHDVYLGCLSCTEFEPDSVHNSIGKYGSSISPSSILNAISLYGSAISPTSACNELATSPPVIVDRTGKYYGELTLNRLRTKRTTIKAANVWLSLACAGKLN